MGLFGKKNKYIGKITMSDVPRQMAYAKSGYELDIVESAARYSQERFEREVSEVIFKNNLSQVGEISNDGITISLHCKVN